MTWIHLVRKVTFPYMIVVVQPTNFIIVEVGNRVFGPDQSK